MEPPVDKPILFSAPMVRAILSNTKTQTRRIVKPQPATFEVKGEECEVSLVHVEGEPLPRIATGRVLTAQTLRWKPGDRLWVREAWRTESSAYDDLKPADMDADYTVLYDADADWKLNKSTGRSRVSIHMPRWASRLTLRVTDVRVERLHNISEDDAKAEGVEPQKLPGLGQGIAQAFNLTHRPYISAYANVWNAINGPGAWEANPWIVALTFIVII
jgi:hypothetical protein